MAESGTTEVVSKIELPAETENVITKQEEEASTPSLPQNESTGPAGLPERPRSRSPGEANHPRGDDRRESPGRQQRGGRGRRKPPPPAYRGRGPAGRPSRPSPGPPPLPPPGPPPAGYRRPERLDSPPPHRRGRSPDPLRRRSSPPLPAAPPPVPTSSSYGRSRYNSPPPRPRRPSSPPRRWGGPRSRSPAPRGYRSPPGPRHRRSPIRSPPPRRRSPAPYRRPPSRSPPYKRPYSPRRSSPSRRSPPRTGVRTRTVSPQPVKHRLPSPGRTAARSRFGPSVRSNTNSRRGSPSARDYSPNGHRKRTRSPDKGDTVVKEEDDHVSKKRRTFDDDLNQDSPMRGIKRESEERPVSFKRFDGGPEGRPPTEPKSFRDANQSGSSSLRVKTEPQDIEMADGTANASSPTKATPATPTTWKVPKAPATRQDTSSGNAASTPGPSTQANQPPPTPIMTVPKMQSWKKDSVTPDLDAEIERVRALRLNMAAEHTTITTAVRRALYELELVDFDLRASEARLAISEKQSELAAKGMPIYIEDNAGR